MDRNWLIRTKNLHILGPVSKAKIKELLSNGSIKGDDEICSGNGYWFSIKEELLVQRYVHSDELQEFNPVSEAKSIRMMKEEESNTESTREDITVGDITQVLNLSSLEDADGSSISLTKQDHSENEVAPLDFKEFKVEEPVEEGSKKKKGAGKKRKHKSGLLSGNLLYLMLVFFFILSILGYYFRFRILTEFLGHLSVFPEVQAQQFVVNPQKKNPN